MTEQSVQFDHEVDVLVVGSGAGGMVAALTARSEGLRPLIIEKSRYWGGSSARSGGGAWVPNAPALLREGQRDDPQQIVDYVVAIAGDRVERGRIERYVEQAPKMMEFLESQSSYLANGFFWISGYSDYHPDLGGNPLGRGLWARPIDRRLLGEEMKTLHPGVRRMQLPLGAWITSVDLHELLAIRWGGLRHKKILLKLAWRVLRARVLGERIGASGQALATRLRLTLRQQGIDIWRETPMQALITDAGGRVIGVEAEREGRPFTIGARHGVVLASGGFDHNLEMRKRYQPGITQDWSLGAATNVGDGIAAGEALGAATDLMEDAWWQPVMPSAADGSLVGLVAERQYPGQFIVNGAGRRFVNEATPYILFCQAQLAGHRTGVSHIPCWMIIDSTAWKRNIIAGHLPGAPMPKPWRQAGVAFKARTLQDLALRIGVSPSALQETADRYNSLVDRGADEDFHRGVSAYDRYYGDPSYPNPNLARVEKPPFYAFAIVPGDLGTKGGLLTDEDARVLRPDGPIPGLYATGNTSASVMGTKYAGPGATLGPAMTFAYVAARHIAAAARAAGAPADSAVAASTETSDLPAPDNASAASDNAFGCVGQRFRLRRTALPAASDNASAASDGASAAPDGGSAAPDGASAAPVAPTTG
jgi:3-oxosteroid 1-dehydrogenase